MSDKKVAHPIRGFFVVLKNLFLLASVLITLFAVAGYFAGWIEFRHDDQQERATIEIKTRKVKATAEDAVEKGKELFGETSDELEEATEEDAEDDTETDKDAGNGSEPNPTDT